MQKSESPSDSTFTDNISEEQAPYFVYKPGYYEWDIKRWRDRKLYGKFQEGKAIYCFRNGIKCTALMNEYGYVLIWLEEKQRQEGWYV